MKKIEKLTKEQKELLAVYRDKWLAIGLSTEPANRAKAERGLELAYAVKGLKKPKFVWCMSPLSQGLTRYSVMNIKKIELGKSVGSSGRESVWDSVRASVWESVWDSVRASVEASVEASVGASVRDSVRDSVRESVWDSVWASVRESVGASVRESVGASVGDSVWASGYGQHDANWLGFYDYFNNVLKLEKQTKDLNGLLIHSQNAGWFLPYENICWISERHNVCNLKNGRIHCDGGPAIAFPDGFKIWALNGTRVPQYLAETPEGNLDIEFFKKETNADIKAEFIRKYGIDRMQTLGKKICDAKKHGNDWFRASEYELVDMGSIYNVAYAPHLRMKNLTTGIFHFEAVSPDCRTIEDALKFRSNGRNVDIVGIK